MKPFTLRILGISLCLVSGAVADLSWDFESPVVHPDALDGIYGYVFPSMESPGQTSKHTATLQRTPWTGSKAAKLNFRLDGARFPSAGFGLMLEDAQPQDFRGLVSLQATIHADRRRQVRLALMGPDAALKAAADTGLTFGRDTTVGTAPVRWSLSLSDLGWPNWATELPRVSRDELLSRIFAVQFQVVCESARGVCEQDSGWIVVDDLRLVGVGGNWTPPPEGDCSGPALAIDAFASGNPRQNDLGGWWYAYTDRSATDSAARGASRILNASVPESAQTWEGPTSTAAQARLAFDLKRRGVYSGYAAIETQLAPPEDDVPQAADFPRAKSLSFTISFDPNYPSSLGGVITHLRKDGKDFQAGADHQVRIPWAVSPRRWCVDLDDLRQPAWSPWIEPFRPTDLLALSFEVKLPPSLSAASGGFSVSDISLHLSQDSRVSPRQSRSARPTLHPVGTGWRIDLASVPTNPVRWAAVRPDGSLIARGDAPAGASQFELPDLGGSMAYLNLQKDGRSWTLTVPRRF